VSPQCVKSSFDGPSWNVGSPLAESVSLYCVNQEEGNRQDRNPHQADFGIQPKGRSQPWPDCLELLVCWCRRAWQGGWGVQSPGVAGAARVPRTVTVSAQASALKVLNADGAWEDKRAASGAGLSWFLYAATFKARIGCLSVLVTALPPLGVTCEQPTCRDSLYYCPGTRVNNNTAPREEVRTD